MGPTPTPTRTSAMRLSCNFVNGYTIAYHVQYTFTRVHARIPNGHPREARKSARRTSRRTSRRGSSCVSGSWQAERGSVRVGVSPMEFKLYAVHSAASCPRVLQWEGGLCRCSDDYLPDCLRVPNPYSPPRPCKIVDTSAASVWRLLRT